MKKIFLTASTLFTLIFVLSINLNNSNTSLNLAFSETVHCTAEIEAICDASHVGGPIIRNMRPGKPIIVNELTSIP